MFRTNKIARHASFFCGKPNTRFNLNARRECVRSVSLKTKETKLVQQMRGRISTAGPLTVAEYMKEVAANPMAGYYMHRDVIGNSGALHSPEISQLYGDVLAEWCLAEWARAGRPKPWYIVEVGPNRGVLSDELLRVLSGNSRAQEVVSLHLVEASPHLSQLQELRLCGTVSVVKDVEEEGNRHLVAHEGEERCYKHSITKHAVPVSWYRSLEDVPRAFSTILAYEHLDAFPIHKLQKTSEGWREVLIDVDAGAGEHHLRYVLSRGPTPASQFFLALSGDDARESVEVSPESGVLVQEVAARIGREGGHALLVDYGHDGTRTDTFRAFRRHELHDPLSEPGTADLTADVDFAYLKKMVEGRALAFGPLTQQEFLTNMGIQAKFQRVLAGAGGESRADLQSSFGELLSPDHLGERVKFLALFPLDSRGAPLGFSS